MGILSRISQTKKLTYTHTSWATSRSLLAQLSLIFKSSLSISTGALLVFFRYTMWQYVREALSASSECVVSSEERMPPVQTSSCPLALAPLNAGGHIDASVGKNLDQKMRITFTSASGQGDPYEACALLGLVKKTQDTPTLDMTQACRRCVRAVRVQSAT